MLLLLIGCDVGGVELDPDAPQVAPLCTPAEPAWPIATLADLEAAWRYATLDAASTGNVFNWVWTLAERRCPERFEQADPFVNLVVGGCADSDGVDWQGVASFVVADAAGVGRSDTRFTNFAVSGLDGYFGGLTVDGGDEVEVRAGVTRHRVDLRYTWTGESVLDLWPQGRGDYVSEVVDDGVAPTGSWSSSVTLGDGSGGATCGTWAVDATQAQVVLVGDRVVRVVTDPELGACGDAVTDDGETLGTFCP